MKYFFNKLFVLIFALIFFASISILLSFRGAKNSNSIFFPLENKVSLNEILKDSPNFELYFRHVTPRYSTILVKNNFVFKYENGEYSISKTDDLEVEELLDKYYQDSNKLIAQNQVGSEIDILTFELKSNDHDQINKIHQKYRLIDIDQNDQNTIINAIELETSAPFEKKFEGYSKNTYGERIVWGTNKSNEGSFNIIDNRGNKKEILRGKNSLTKTQIYKYQSEFGIKESYWFNDDILVIVSAIPEEFLNYIDDCINKLSLVEKYFETIVSYNYNCSSIEQRTTGFDEYYDEIYKDNASNQVNFPYKRYTTIYLYNVRNGKWAELGPGILPVVKFERE